MRSRCCDIFSECNAQTRPLRTLHTLPGKWTVSSCNFGARIAFVSGHNFEAHNLLSFPVIALALGLLTFSTHFFGARTAFSFMFLALWSYCNYRSPLFPLFSMAQLPDLPGDSTRTSCI